MKKIMLSIVMGLLLMQVPLQAMEDTLLHNKYNEFRALLKKVKKKAEPYITKKTVATGIGLIALIAGATTWHFSQKKLDAQLFDAVKMYYGNILDQPIRLVRTAIQKGANPNARDQAGSTPLHWAVAHRYLPNILYLIDKGAYINAQDNEGNTPLHIAADKLPTHVEYIIDQHEKVTSLEEEKVVSISPKYEKKIIKELFKHGAKIIKNKKDQTPIDVALNGGRLDIANFILLQEYKSYLKN